MTSSEIRSTFLEYFAQQGHSRVASSPLVPGDDPTLLFTNAGMNQFKDVFLGRESRGYTRAASSQKCMRVSGKHNDLDNVGPSLRHHTFFEMLGNFSFGDYFKAEAIRFAWTLLTEVWQMPPERLVVSIFKGDERVPRDAEAYDLWRAFVPAERILELGAEDNFWQMGETGPCGRCSEIYYVRGTGQDADIEIWNNVFMEFERSADGTLSPLPAPSIDTGMGLERITAVLQHKASNYDTDVFAPLLAHIGELAGVTYGGDPKADVSMRVVADHARATTFLIGDGVIPSNEWRGYVLRKIMRRGMRHGKHLGMKDPFLHRLVETLANTMGHVYPELVSGRAMIERTILAEEHRFDVVLTEGLPRLEAEIAKVGGRPSAALPGDVAFRLYDTFGIPFDFIEDTAAVHGIGVDRAGFETAMEAQRHRARAQSAFGAGPKKSEAFVFTDEADARGVGDTFEGYTATRLTGVPIVALFNEAHQPVDSLPDGARGYVALTRTPFYAEAGGQVSDAGQLVREPSGARAIVEGLTRTGQGMPRVHAVRVEGGQLRTRDAVTAEVDEVRRDATRRHHTATHLLHAALRRTLGSHVKQAGSLVAPDRLRFDFVHFEPIAEGTLERIEWLVNEHIIRNAPVQTEVRSTADAIAAGAMALFGEKYGEHVRVVTVPGFSMELCGGTHVRATGDIGLFAIVAEGGVAAGVRRIEAVTGLEAVKLVHEQRAALRQLLGALHASAPQALETVERLRAENRKLSAQVEELVMQSVLSDSSGVPRSRAFPGLELRAQQRPGLTRDQLRTLADKLREGLDDGIVVAATETDGKPSFVVAVTPGLTARFKAGDLVKKLAPIIGGGGGGRPDFAEAGGKLLGRLEALFDEAERLVEAAVASAGTQK